MFGTAKQNGSQATAEKVRNGLKRLSLEELRPVFTDEDGSAAFNFTDSKGRTFRVRINRYS